MPILEQAVGRAFKIVVAGACCFGIWGSLTLARADYLFRQDTEESIRKAIRLMPEGWEYYMRLAQFDRAHARELLTRSLRLTAMMPRRTSKSGCSMRQMGTLALPRKKQLLEAFEGKT